MKFRQLSRKTEIRSSYRVSSILVLNKGISNVLRHGVTRNNQVRVIQVLQHVGMLLILSGTNQVGRSVNGVHRKIMHVVLPHPCLFFFMIKTAFVGYCKVL